jgi:hypothetical protein
MLRTGEPRVYKGTNHGETHFPPPRLT